jgi:hypothetical protein
VLQAKPPIRRGLRCLPKPHTAGVGTLVDVQGASDPATSKVRAVVCRDGSGRCPQSLAGHRNWCRREWPQLAQPRFQPKTAFWRFPPVRKADLEGSKGSI